MPYIGSLVPYPAPRAHCVLKLGGFPHRILDTFAGDATSWLPPAESRLLLELPTQPVVSLLEHVLEFCCPPLCLQVLLPDIP